MKLERSQTMPAGVLYGNSSGFTRFRRRISFGSRPSLRPAMSTSRSITNVDVGRPPPRYGPPGLLLVHTPRTRPRYAGTRYGPGRKLITCTGSSAAVHG